MNCCLSWQNSFYICKTLIICGVNLIDILCSPVGSMRFFCHVNILKRSNFTVCSAFPFIEVGAVDPWSWFIWSIAWDFKPIRFNRKAWSLFSIRTKAIWYARSASPYKQKTKLLSALAKSSKKMTKLSTFPPDSSFSKMVATV